LRDLLVLGRRVPALGLVGVGELDEHRARVRPLALDDARALVDREQLAAVLHEHLGKSRLILLVSRTVRDRDLGDDVDGHAIRLAYRRISRETRPSEAALGRTTAAFDSAVTLGS